MNFASVFLDPNRNFQMFTYYFVMEADLSCAIARTSIVLYYKKEILAVVDQINRNFIKPMQSTFRQVTKIYQVSFLNNFCW